MGVSSLFITIVGEGDLHTPRSL